MNNRDREPLTPEEHELAQQLGRLGGPVPSPALDARILASARAAVEPGHRRDSRPRRRQWPMGLGVAASLALAVGIAWQLRPLPDDVRIEHAGEPATDSTEDALYSVPVIESPAEPASAPPSGNSPMPSPTITAAQPVPAPSPPQPAETAEQARRAPPPSRTAEPVRQQSAKQSRATAMQEALEADARRQEAESPPLVFDAPSAMGMPAPPPPPPPPPAPPAPAPGPAATAAEKAGSTSVFVPSPPANAPAREREQAPAQPRALRPAAAPAVAAERAAARTYSSSDVLETITVTGSRIQPSEPAAEADQPEQEQPPASADSPEVRKAWLQRIRELARAGDYKAAADSLREFVRRHPQAVVPEDLQPLLDE